MVLFFSKSMPKKRLRISRASQLSDGKKKDDEPSDELKQREETPTHPVNSSSKNTLALGTKRPRATLTPHRHKIEQASTVSAQPSAQPDVPVIVDHTSPRHTTARRLSSFTSALSPDTNTSLEVTWDYRKTESTPPGSDKDLSDILYHFPAIDSPVSTRNSSPLSLSILPVNLTNRRSIRNSKDKEGLEKLRLLASRLCGHQETVNLPSCEKPESNGVEGGEVGETMSDVDSICDRESMLDQFFADTDDSLDDEVEKSQYSAQPMAVGADHGHTPDHHTVHPPNSHSLHPLDLVTQSSSLAHSSCPSKSTFRTSPQLPNPSSHPPISSYHQTHPSLNHSTHPSSAHLNPPPVHPISSHHSLPHKSAASSSTASNFTSAAATAVDDLYDDDDDLFWAMATNALEETERKLQKEKELNETIDELFFNPVESPPTASCIKVCSQEDIEKKRQLAKRKLKQRLQTI